MSFFRRSCCYRVLRAQMWPVKAAAAAAAPRRLSLHLKSQLLKGLPEEQSDSWRHRRMSTSALRGLPARRSACMSVCTCSDLTASPEEMKKKKRRNALSPTARKRLPSASLMSGIDCSFTASDVQQKSQAPPYCLHSNPSKLSHRGTIFPLTPATMGKHKNYIKINK